MAKIGIYVPKYKRVGNENKLERISDALYRKHTLNICKELSRICGGCTSIDVMGYFNFNDGFFSECPAMEIYAFCKDDEVTNVADALKPIVVDVRMSLGQRAIGMYVNDSYLET